MKQHAKNVVSVHPQMWSKFRIKGTFKANHPFGGVNVEFPA